MMLDCFDVTYPLNDWVRVFTQDIPRLNVKIFLKLLWSNDYTIESVL